jgi:Holliday junction DNA helicase RuvA
VDVGGVGYEVTVSGAVLLSLGQAGEDIRLVVATDVKENAITLFGFQDYAEREVFHLLKKVKGIGSKIALGILSALDSESLLLSIGRGDVSALSRVPGVGKKTAERIVVELREQVAELARSLPGEPLALQVETIRTANFPGGLPASAGDAMLALEKLGFAPDRARRAVVSALELEAAKTPNDAGEILRHALTHLNR